MKPEPLQAAIRRYQAQLLRYRAQASRTDAPAVPKPEAAPAAAPEPEPGYDSAGTLTIAVTTARAALPVPGAGVFISRRDAAGAHLLYFLETDRSGRTPAVQLPAPAAARSESPEARTPYAVYDVRVTAPDYMPVTQSAVRVFGGASGTVPVSLTPANAS